MFSKVHTAANTWLRRQYISLTSEMDGISGTLGLSWDCRCLPVVHFIAVVQNTINTAAVCLCRIDEGGEDEYAPQSASNQHLANLISSQSRNA